MRRVLTIGLLVLASVGLAVVGTGCEEALPAESWTGYWPPDETGASPASAGFLSERVARDWARNYLCRHSGEGCPQVFRYSERINNSALRLFYLSGSPFGCEHYYRVVVDRDENPPGTNYTMNVHGFETVRC